MFESKIDPSQMEVMYVSTESLATSEELQSKSVGWNAQLDTKELKEFLQKARMDPVSHIKSLSKQLPPMEVTQKQTKEYVKHIRDQKFEEEASKKDRELRRRRLLLSQQLVQEEFQKSQLEQLMLQKLQRHSKQERRIAEQYVCLFLNVLINRMMQVRHEKQVMKENRIFREKQYAERRQKDYEEALDKEFELAERAREEFQRQTALQLAQHLEILEKKSQLKHKKTVDMISKLTNEIIDLSLKVAEYRSLNDGQELPPKLLREWKTLLLHEQPVYKQFELPLEKDDIRPKEQNAKVEPDVLKTLKVLDEQEFQEYLNGSNEWKYVQDGS